MHGEQNIKFCLLDICHWGASVAVTVRIRGVGQKVLQYSFQTGNSSSHSYCHIFFLIAYLEKTFIENNIKLWINYTIIIIIFINNNDNVIINTLRTDDADLRF